MPFPAQNADLPVIPPTPPLWWACREEAPDVWQVRDPMPKPWQDFVTMRLLVRGPLPAAQQGGPPVFAVKWHMPHQDNVEQFMVTDGSLAAC